MLVSRWLTQRVKRRTVSGYVMNIVMRSVDFDDDMFARIFRPGWVGRGAGPRTQDHGAPALLGSTGEAGTKRSQTARNNAGPAWSAALVASAAEFRSF